MNTGCLRLMTSMTGAGIGEIHRILSVMCTVPHLVHPFIPIANIQFPITHQPHQVPLLIALHMMCSPYHLSYNPCSMGFPPSTSGTTALPPLNTPLLHAQNHPRHQDAIAIEEIRFSRTSQSTHPPAETAHAALNRICGSHHQVVVPPRVHEKSPPLLHVLLFAVLLCQSICVLTTMLSLLFLLFSSPIHVS